MLKRRETSRKLRFFNKAGSVLLYDTAFNGPWTLTSYSLSAPERVTNYVTIPGRDGEVDLSAAISDEPQYKNRRLVALFENSDGKKADREALISDVMNRLNGRYFRIFTPDDAIRYLTGYVQVSVKYSDVNHCAIEISASVDPWRESIDRVFFDVEASSTAKTIRLINNGGRRVIPSISAYTGTATPPDITITCGDYTAHPTADAIKPPELAMGYKDDKLLTYSGSGHLVIVWKEASL